MKEMRGLFKLGFSSLTLLAVLNHRVFLFLDRLTLSVWMLCMCILSVSHVCVCPTDIRRGYFISWTWCSRILWANGYVLQIKVIIWYPQFTLPSSTSHINYEQGVLELTKTILPDLWVHELKVCPAYRVSIVHTLPHTHTETHTEYIKSVCVYVCVCL